MITIHIDEECAAPVEYAFRYVADYRNSIRYLYGLSKFEPVTAIDRGVGSIFDGSLRLGPVVLNSRMKSTAWDEPELIRSESIQGVNTRFTYRFAAVDAARSRVELLIENDFLGRTGKVMAKAIAPLVDQAAEKTGSKLAEQIAAFYAEHKTA
ncbi:SRPBCC family protein [Nocardia asteroides]